MDGIEAWTADVKRAEAGELDALLSIADFIVWHDRTQPIEPEDLALAQRYYNEAIRQGSSDAMVSVGAMYYVGRGVAQDFTKAVHWYTKAAEHGNVTAMSNLGYCYYYGRNVPVDMEKAYQMFSKAMEHGDAVSCYKLGDMYLYGKYVAKDAAKAFELYMFCYCIVKDEPSLDCYPDVCARLGRCYHHGEGTTADLHQAACYLSEALQGFQQRMKDGDTMTNGVYRRSSEEYQEVLRQLTGTSSGE